MAFRRRPRRGFRPFRRSGRRRMGKFVKKNYTWVRFQSAAETSTQMTTGVITLDGGTNFDFAPLVGDNEAGGGSVEVPKLWLVVLELWYDIFLTRNGETDLVIPPFHLTCGLVAIQGRPLPGGTPDIGVGVDDFHQWSEVTSTEDKWRLWRRHPIGCFVKSADFPSSGPVALAQLRHDSKQGYFKWTAKLKGSLDKLMQMCFFAELTQNDFFGSASGLSGQSVQVIYEANMLLQS